jgi:hypothetical protein
VTVTTEESWDGLLPRLLQWPLGRVMRKTVHDAVENGLRYLKAECERRSSRIT